MKKIGADGIELKAGDRVLFKATSFDSAIEGVVWENQIGTDEKTVRLAIGDPTKTGRIQTVFLSKVVVS